MDVIQKNAQIAAILSGLRESHVILSGLLLEIPDEIFRRKRGDGGWSIAAHGAHLADVQPMMVDRIKRILSEDVPEFIPFIPDEEEQEPLSDLPEMSEVLRNFKRGRDELITLLNDAQPGDWERKALHPEYDQYGLFILARHILMHDHWHMYRMEELWLTRDEYLTRLEG